MNKLKLTFLIGAIITIALSSCRKDKSSGNEVDISDVYIRLDHKVGSSDFYMDTVYVDDFGTSYYFTRAQMYLSNFSFGGVDLNTYLLVDTEGTDYKIGAVPEGHHHELDFHIGVDSLTNHEDPAQYSLSHPLGIKTPSTHWGWSSGYLFIMLEGQVDTTGDGIMDDSFVFHIGSDMNYKDVSVTVHQDVGSETAYVNLLMDWGALFNGVDLKNDHKTHTMDNMPLATAVVNNAINIFSTP